MSHKTLHEVTCPHCQYTQKIERYNSLNNFDSDKFELILNKEIFHYECKNCHQKNFEPYPFLFHLMSAEDIQIGYKMTPMHVMDAFKSPLILALQRATNKKDITERYDELDDFINRVDELIKTHYYH